MRRQVEKKILPQSLKFEDPLCEVSSNCIFRSLNSEMTLSNSAMP